MSLSYGGIGDPPTAVGIASSTLVVVLVATCYAGQPAERTMSVLMLLALAAVSYKSWRNDDT